MRRELISSKKICLTLAVGILLVFSACKNGNNRVWLEDGSQGKEGDSMVYDLDPGSMYLVRSSQTWYPVNAEGKLGKALLQLNYRELNEVQIAHELESLDPDITAITGLSNDMVISVFKYGRPTTNSYLVHGTTSSQDANQFITNQKNMVIDLGSASFSNLARITMMDNVLDARSIFIFVMADTVNIPQDNTVTGTTQPKVEGGADWYYNIGNMHENVSSSRPFRVWVSAKPGQNGYFTISGPPPSNIAKRSKRLSGDHDIPPSTN